MSTDARPDLLDRLAVLGEHLDAEREARVTQNIVGVDRRPVRRSLVALVAAAAVTVIGLTALTQLERRNELAQRPAATTPSVSDAAGPTAPLPSQTTDATAADANPGAVVPVGEITWERATGPGSVARSQVSRVVAGPSGFVAIGMGFDDGRNQGRVWHSTDGLVWDEPAFDLFDSRSVSGVAATSDAHYVIAGTNPDRLGLGEGASSPDVQLFRSTNGRSWEPWGEPWGYAGAVAAADDVLLRSPEVGMLEWSIDGLDWTSASFTDVPVDDAYFDILGGVTQIDETAYLRGFTADKFTVWSSTDGRSWQQLPTPPDGGAIAAVPDGLVMITNPREEECAALSNRQIDDLHTGPTPPSGADLQAAADARWACAAQPDVYRYNSDSATWSLDPHHLGETPASTSIARLGNTLVAPLVEPAKALTIWTAAADTPVWHEQAPTRLTYDDNIASPGMAVIATSADRVVVFTEDRQVDGETAIIVGSLESASG
jgi:hypothetical protein